MPSKDKDNLAEEFVVTTLKRHFKQDPQAAIRLAIQYYKYNSELRYECRCLCESINMLDAKIANLTAIQEFNIENNQKLQSALKKSRLQLLFLWFLLSFILTLFYCLVN
jgi:cytochrome oxidase assembly protein ShyY1